MLCCPVPFAWLRFARTLKEHNSEFNPNDVFIPAPKRAIDVVPAFLNRQKLEGLDEADFAELMEAGPQCIVRYPMYTLLLTRPTISDLTGTVWIASKRDMVLDPNDVLFSFGTGRRPEHC
jgi:hypothetical protein